jgi:hypothetical protein
MRRRGFNWLAFLAAFLWLVRPFSAGGQDAPSVEYKVKAAFLYNFAKFVEWPDEAFSDKEETFILCVLGKDPFGPNLKALEGKLVRGRKLSVIQCKDIQEVEEAHILFIARSERKRVTEVLSRLENQPVLTVSDVQGFAEQGGGIGFIDVDKKLRFEINPEATKKAGLQVSSQLMKLANVVR